VIAQSAIKRRINGRASPAVTRPEDLIYGVDELPPLPQLVFLGAQHAVLMSVYLVLIVIVFRSAQASHAATLNALSLGMVALAISTVLQAIWKGPVGSGYLAPPVFRRSTSVRRCWRPTPVGCRRCSR